jgi:hypothetical protein
VSVNDAHIFYLRDGKAAESWNASAGRYACDELIG